MKQFLTFLFVTFALVTSAADNVVTSPDGKLVVKVSVDNGMPTYSVDYDGATMLTPSALGFVADFGDFTKGLAVTATRTNEVNKHYTMAQSKKSSIDYHANQLEIDFENAQGLKMTLTFQVSNNDVAFRYAIPRQKNDNPKCAVIYREASAFNFPETATTFLCPQIGPMTGWERTKPSYEEDYDAEMPLNVKSRFGMGYTFPCLFKVSEGHWALVGETGVSSAYCASHLSDYQPGVGYTIAFPHAGENNGIGSPHAGISLPGTTPWRTITLGNSLKPIVETTIPFDVVDPLYEPTKDFSFGRYTWSWLLWQDNSVNYDDQVKFIDLASAMGFEYCLVDNWWDQNIGRERMAELSKYAQSKGVRLMLWYNSNGFENDAPQTPRDCMATAYARNREMKWLKEIGVVGIKVDFFGGDKQETMKLYEDILSDANRYGLQVVFHGCTIPRGWERMYPNYVASEAALASENLFFNQQHCDREGFELNMHPYSRNALGAFDWGGVVMNRRMSKDNASRNYRRTSNTFEMATGIILQTAVNCVAMQPNNLNELQQFEMDFLRELPTQWDDVCFLDGYPTKYTVLARKHGDKWYVAGINGTDLPMTLTLDLPMFAGKTVDYYTDRPTAKTENAIPEPELRSLKVDKKGRAKVTIQPMGGIILK